MELDNWTRIIKNDKCEPTREEFWSDAFKTFKLDPSLNLYLVEKPKSYAKSSCKSCWVYERFVACCETEDDAREMHPRTGNKIVNCDHSPSGELVDGWLDGKDSHLLKVTLLGKADSSLKRGVITTG